MKREMALAFCVGMIVATASPLRAEEMTCPTPGTLPEVVTSRRIDFQGAAMKLETTPWTQLDHPVLIVLCNLTAWAREHDLRELRLYVAGRMVPASRPVLINRTQEYVIFKMSIDSRDRALWVDILAEARRAEGHRIPISVGTENQPFASSQYIVLSVYPAYTRYVVAFLVILLAGLSVLGYSSDLLRVPKPPADGDRAPYSLAFTQMAWWFYLVMAAYLYIWLVTSEFNTLTESVLALIGISATTGLAAVLIDREKESQRAPNAQVQTSQKSKGLIRDLLSDGEGVSFHRFQMVTWTVVLGVVFIRSVYQDLAMPTISPSLLGLLGLSSGTYLGFKWPETTK